VDEEEEEEGEEEEERRRRRTRDHLAKAILLRGNTGRVFGSLSEAAQDFLPPCCMLPLSCNGRLRACQRERGRERERGRGREGERERGREGTKAATAVGSKGP
jgi:hypothetical protein